MTSTADTSLVKSDLLKRIRDLVIYADMAKLNLVEAGISLARESMDDDVIVVRHCRRVTENRREAERRTK